MVSKIINFFANFGVWVVVAVCSCMPAVETKIAVPLGASSVWGSNALDLWMATLVAFLSSTIFAIFVFLFSKFLLKTLQKHKKPKFLLSILEKVQQFLQVPLQKISNKKSSVIFLFLVLFVSVPLPVCGLFSGAILCAFLKAKTKVCIFALILGNLLDCFFVLMLCLALKPFLSLLLTVFVIIAILFVSFYVLRFVLQKFEQEKLKKHKNSLKN